MIERCRKLVMKMKHTLPFVALMVLLFSCKNEKVPVNTPSVPKLQLHCSPSWNGESVSTTSKHTTPEGYIIQFTTLKFYVSELKNGSNNLGDVFLYDWSKGSKFGEIAGDKSQFANLIANLGVPADVNHNDPAAFPNDNPLNISIANDMFWSWSPGYIFVKIEAKADTIPDAIENLDHNLVYHIGLDENLQPISWTGLNWKTVSGNVSKLDLDVNLFEVFYSSGNEVNVKTEYTCHSAPGQEVLANKVISNFNAALQPQ